MKRGARTFAWFAVAASLVVTGCGDSKRAAADCRRDFDRSAWRAPDRTTETPTVRQRLADDLVDCRALIGLSREEVRALLGPPDHGRSRSPLWEYVTGPQRVMPIDSELLDLDFEGERVAKVSLTND